MINLVLGLIIIFSLGGVIFIITRKIILVKRSSLKEVEKMIEDNKEISESFSRVSRIRIFEKFKSFDYHKYGALVMIFLEKLLFRFKIISLRTENTFSQWIAKIRETSENWKIHSKDWVRKNKFKTSKSPKSTNGIKEGLQHLQNFEEGQKQGYEYESEEYYINLIIKNPHDAEVYRKLGKFYLKQRNLEDARASFEMANKLEKDSSKNKKNKKAVSGHK